ncbi:MAG: hypothetical protein JJE04_24715 [Acidobacteriia bacterium]|nr:hypothetical protein [Terriglobia bacterium]
MMTQNSYAAAYQNGLPSTIRLLLSKGLLIEEAEEFAQAAWVRGWEARQQLHNNDRVVPWVNRIAINTLCTEKCRSKRYVELDESRKHQTDPSPIAAKIDVESLLNQCSELDRSLMLHRYVGGLEMQEIARIHGMTRIATRVRIHRAKMALRRYAGVGSIPMAA